MAMAKSVLDAGPPPVEKATPMPPPADTAMPPGSYAGDIQATQDLNALICRFHMAVAFHDHEKALAAMKAGAPLAAKASPALAQTFMAEVRRYMATFEKPTEGR